MSKDTVTIVLDNGSNTGARVEVSRAHVADHLRDAADDVARAIAAYWAGDKTDPDCPTYIIKTIFTPEEWQAF